MRAALMLAGAIALAQAGISHGQTQMQGNEGAFDRFRLGLSVTSLALDNARVPDVKTSSPGHSSKMAGVMLGVSLDPDWSIEAHLATDFDAQVDTDWFTLGARRAFGGGALRPYLGAGLGFLSVDQAVDDNTTQAYVGLGVAGRVGDGLELRLGYQQHRALTGDHYQDHAYTAAASWRFGAAPQPVSMAPATVAPVAVAEPEPAPEPMPPAVQPVELRVQFALDSAEISDAYEDQFGAFSRVFEAYPGATVIIEGHTCWLGTEAYNQDLSQRRAEAVRDKFIADYGVDPERLEAVGYGENQPVADNATQAGREANRRVMVHLPR